MFRFPVHLLAKTLSPLLLVGISGCGTNGPPLGYVEGYVTINDEPASNAIVEFQPAEKGGSPSIGFADEDGRYRLQFSGSRRGALLGEHIVRVTFDDDPSPDRPATGVQIPPRYNKRSELKAVVEPGSNYHDFDLIVENTAKQSVRK